MQKYLSAIREADIRVYQLNIWNPETHQLELVVFEPVHPELTTD